MGKLVFNGPLNSTCVVGDVKLKPGDSIDIPFVAISEHQIMSKDFEVYNDVGELIEKPVKKFSRMGETRIKGKPKTEEKESSKEEVKTDSNKKEANKEERK